MAEEQQPERLAPGQDMYYAKYLVDFYGDELAYVPRWAVWYRYTGSHWERDNSGMYVHSRAAMTTRRMLYNEHAIVQAEKRQSEDPSAPLDKAAKARLSRAAMAQNNPRVRGIVELARADPRVQREYTVFDAKPHLLACRNGVLDLDTGVFRKNNPLDYLTKAAPVHYDPSATAPMWDKFLAQVLPEEEVRAFVQRFFGYCLTGYVGERLFMVLYGSGANGKTVLLETMQKLMGDYAVVAPPTLLMAKKFDTHPAETATLYGARLAISSEVRKGKAFDEEVVKRLTGNDTISTRRMHENYWDFIPTHKIVLACNHRPRVGDTSESFWDRLVLIPFDVRIPEAERIPDLQGKFLRQESSGILNWALEGLRAYKADGLKLPASVKAAAREYRIAEDRLAEFFADKCEFGAQLREPSQRLVAAMRDWATGLNLYVPSSRELGERLRESGCVEYRTAKERGWKGIALRGNTLQLVPPQEDGVQLEEAAK